MTFAKPLLAVSAICALSALGGCDTAVKTFDDATRDVNEDFALGKALRDRCNSTGDVDHCAAWVAHKRAAEAENELLDYEKGLRRWEANGPY